MQFRFWPNRKTSQTAPPSRPSRFRACLESLEKREVLATMCTYCTNQGPKRGPFLYCDAQDSSVSVMEWPGAGRPVGRAVSTSWAWGGAALWKLVIGGSVLPGRYVIRDRRFTRAR
jgi:hypothetical protein